jgi:hypothetical protein
MTADDEAIFIRITEAGDTRITEAGDTRILSGIAELTIGDHDTFEAGDILRIKEGTDDEWLMVNTTVDAPTYGVVRDLAGSYAADSKPAWTNGASVANYGQSGDGGIYITASDTNAPNLSVFTHGGSPWNDITTHLRLGNLNGYAGYETDTYGLAAYIDTNNYIKIDPTNGIRMTGSIVITGGSGIGNLSDAGALATQNDLDGVPDGESYGRVAKTVIDSGYLYLLRRYASSTERLVITASGIEGYANNVKNFELASGIAYLGDQSNEHIKVSSSGLEIKDSSTVLATYGANVTIGEVGASKSNVYITSGAVQLRNNTTAKLTLASDGSIALDSGIITGTAGYIRGGQTDYATGTGFFLGYSGAAYKFSVGDASKYLRWDGSALSIGGDVIATGNIKTNAVSIPVSAYTAASISCALGGTVVQTTNITSTGAPIHISVSCILSGTTNPWMQIKRGAVVIYGSGTIIKSLNNASPFAASISDTPGAGTFSYTLVSGATGGSPACSCRSMLLLEMKR